MLLQQFTAQQHFIYMQHKSVIKIKKLGPIYYFQLLNDYVGGGRGTVTETVSPTTGQIGSTILVPRATLADSGNYTCMTSSPAVAKSHVKVHVLIDGECAF